ncbi:hypothetical protein BaRGS_00008303 [Batillaria attramentaria]|uniref:N-acetyltransferase domain-containing protein n=1 Tax=Batillaria attramentaria TaxID=370345 RepID=A0ABD0LLH3_9CAEN
MASAHGKTHADSEDEQLCLATLSDYDAVMAIDRNVYSGLDYLPHGYPTLLQKPGVSAFVLKKGGRVVGFITAEFIDGGQTLLTSAGRIATDCREGGLFSRFTKSVFEQFRGSRGLKYLAFTTNNLNMAANGHKILKTYRIVDERILTTVMMDVSQARQKAPQQTTHFPGLRQLSREDIQVMMSRDPADIKHLFPNGRVLVQWCPYRIIPENADSVYGGGHPRAFLASSGKSLKNCDTTSTEFPGTMLSCSYSFYIKLGHKIEIEVFGTGSEEEMRAHVENHFRRLIDTCSEKEAFVHVSFSRNLDDILHGMKDPFCLRPSGSPINKIFSLEGDYQAVVSKE